jgi:hypothetical protein
MEKSKNFDNSKSKYSHIGDKLVFLLIIFGSLFAMGWLFRTPFDFFFGGYRTYK